MSDWVRESIMGHPADAVVMPDLVINKKADLSMFGSPEEMFIPQEYYEPEPFEFTDDQQNALDLFIDFLATDEKYFRLQGSAGTGKSTLIEHLKLTVEKNHEMYELMLGEPDPLGLNDPFEMALTATTNPAVAVLEDLTKIPAKTIFSLLQLIVVNNYKNGTTSVMPSKRSQPIHNKLILVDEASMVDEGLMCQLDNRTPGCKVVLIGDWYQLASVGQTKCTMESMTGPIAYMNKIMRNSGPIMEIGQQFRHTVEDGIFKPIPTDQANIFWLDGPAFQEAVDVAFMHPEYTPKRSKMLAWTNKTVLAYSEHIRSIRGLPAEFEEGEEVITNKPILNGRGSYRKPVDSVVKLTKIGEPYLHEIAEVWGKDVELDGKHTAFLPTVQVAAKAYIEKLRKAKEFTEHFKYKEAWLDLRSPYASTVHKAQGSSYDEVFINLSDIGKCRVPSDVARMLYVAFSRARKRVYLYGSLPAWYNGTHSTPMTAEIVKEMMAAQRRR